MGKTDVYQGTGRIVPFTLQLGICRRLGKEHPGGVVKGDVVRAVIVRTKKVRRRMDPTLSSVKTQQ